MTAPAETDADTLFAYVERFFRRSAWTEWPTVRRAARTLKWPQARVADAIAGDAMARMFMTSVFNRELGNQFVEAYDFTGDGKRRKRP